MSNNDDYCMFVCVVWKSDEIIGYTHTYREADEICNRTSDLVWDYNIHNKKTKSGYIKKSLY